MPYARQAHKSKKEVLSCTLPRKSHRGCRLDVITFELSEDARNPALPNSLSRSTTKHLVTRVNDVIVGLVPEKSSTMYANLLHTVRSRYYSARDRGVTSPFHASRIATIPAFGLVVVAARHKQEYLSK